jgi:hypothetical protein
MAHSKIFVCSVAVAVLSLLLVAGCGPSTGGTATFALKFKPGDSANYKFAMENEDNVTFEGSITKNPNFKSGYNLAKTEMTFNQQTQNVDDHGNAIAKITVRDIKYSLIRDGNTILGFDSADEKDRNNSLAKLIGQSYTIEIAPDGQVKKVSDTKQALAAVSGSELANKVALRLLTPETIEKIHETLVLPQAGKEQLRQGQSWSNIKTFNYRALGTSSYERIYTVKEIKRQGDRQIAVVQMNAVPSSADVNSLREKQGARTVSEIFGADTTQTYAGRLEMDLSSGKIQKYSEKLQSQWLIVDPEAEQKGDKEPSAVKMGVVRAYSLERVD